LYVATGGPLSDYFDAVIPLEETEYVDESSIRVLKKMSVGQFIRDIGFDIARGQPVLEKE
jgi:molybdopterin biosynthesis enzyme